MAYPPALPPTSRADATLMAGNHAADHNALAQAVADLLAELGADPSGSYADLTSRLADLQTGIATAQAIAGADYASGMTQQQAVDKRVGKAGAQVSAEAFGADGTGTDAVADSDAIVAALAFGRTVALRKDKTYLIDRNLNLGPGQKLLGNGATLKRRAQLSTTTTTAITSGTTTQITVADVTGFRVGQSIALLNGSTFDTSNRVISAIDVAAKKITVSTAFGISVTGTTTVYLSFNTLTLASDCLVDDVKVDGNKAAWTFYRWQNTSELVTNADRNIVRGLYINNAPGEGIVMFGNRNVVRDSWLTNLNGNGVHFSGASHPVCDNVTVINPNLDTAVGHADGCIIWSNAITHATVTNCYLEGGISGIGSIDSGDDSDVTIKGNTIVNPTTYAIDAVANNLDQARMVIVGNRFYLNGNTPVTISNTNAAPTLWPSQVIFANNYLSGPAGATLVSLSRVKKVTVQGNHFDLGAATTGIGLNLSLNDGVNARGNTFTGGAYGVVAATNVRLTLGGNHFYNQNSAGINMTDADTSALIEGNFITNDATAAAGYNGIIARQRHVVRGNYVELTGGRSGIYPTNGQVIVKGNTVRHGAATYSIRCDGGTSGIVLKDNEVTTAISNSSGAANPESGTVILV